MKYLYTIGLCLIFIFLGNVSITNAQLNPAPSANSSTTQCPSCGQGQICIKTASGNLVCRDSATNCSSACGTGKVCVKATPTATTGTCVDDAPASAKSQANTAQNNGNNTSTSTSNNPTGLLQGLQQFQGANSGLNTGGTLIGYVANIIRWILGILGTVFFIIVVLQGYIYMTAGGDSSKTAAATGAITNAVVGLLIIMGAFLITNFVTSGLINSGG